MNKKWDDRNNGLLGKSKDAEVARKLGVPVHLVISARSRLGIPSFRSRGPGERERAQKKLATMTDEELMRPLARMFKSQRTAGLVTAERVRRGLPRYPGKWRYRQGVVSLQYVMVQAALSVTPRPSLSDVGRCMGVSKQRVDEIVRSGGIVE